MLRFLWMVCLPLAVMQPAMAQHWASRDVCDVRTIDVFESAFAPASLTEISAAAANIPNGNGRLWQIEAPNGAVSHIWGTMHSSHPRILDLPAQVHKLIEKARAIALEVDPIASTRRDFELVFERRGWFRNGRSNTSFEDSGVAPEIQAWIRSRTHGIGWGRDAPDVLTLGALAELLLSDPCDDFSAGVLPVQDGRIQMLGMIAGADIVALEPSERIRTFLDRTAEPSFAVDFVSVFGAYLNPEADWRDRATSFALYQQGEIAKMMAWDRAYVSAVLGDAGEAVDRVNAYILDQRNQTFFDNARSELDMGGVFIAVGAFHLPGKAGLIALMKDAGYRVTRVPLAGERQE